MITPTFENVQGGEYDINQLKVAGAPDQMANINVMNAKGEWVGMYFWYNEYNDGETIWPSGWFDVDGVEMATVTLKAGEAVYFYTDQENVTVQTAGQVSGEITRPLPVGYTMIGNASPVDMDVNDIKISGALDQMANINVMNAKGEWIGMYFWYNEYDDGETIWPSGWFDVDGVEMAEVKLNPGEAVYFYTDQENVSVTIPSALK